VLQMRCSYPARNKFRRQDGADPGLAEDNGGAGSRDEVSTKHDFAVAADGNDAAAEVAGNTLIGRTRCRVRKARDDGFRTTPHPSKVLP
jgi:hypothetical protein